MVSLRKMCGGRIGLNWESPEGFPRPSCMAPGLSVSGKSFIVGVSIYMPMAMSTPKNEVKKILEQVPDDASFEDIQYHIYVCQKIKKGLKDIDEGRLLTQKEIERRMSRWLAM